MREKGTEKTITNKTMVMVSLREVSLAGKNRFSHKDWAGQRET